MLIEFISKNIPRIGAGHCDRYFPGRDHGSAQGRWRSICPAAADGRAPLYRRYSDVRDRQIEIQRGRPAFVTRGQPATADLGIDLRSLVYLSAQLSELAIRVVL